MLESQAQTTATTRPLPTRGSLAPGRMRALVVRLGAPPWVALVGVLLLVGGLAFLVTLRRRTAAMAGAGATSVIAVLATPVAWVHYYVLAFPAWLAVFATAGGPPQTAGSRSSRKIPP